MTVMTIISLYKSTAHKRHPKRKKSPCTCLALIQRNTSGGVVVAFGPRCKEGRSIDTVVPRWQIYKTGSPCSYILCNMLLEGVGEKNNNNSSHEIMHSLPLICFIHWPSSLQQKNYNWYYSAYHNFNLLYADGGGAKIVTKITFLFLWHSFKSKRPLHNF